MEKRKLKPKPTDREEVEAMFSGSESHDSTAHGALMRGRKKKEGRPMFESLQTLAEAKVDRAKREVRCAVISEGMGNNEDKHFYGPQAITDTAQLINGARVYVNHATESEQDSRPEGDLWNQGGYWKDGIVAQIPDRETGKTKRGVVATIVCDESAAGDEILSKAEHALKFQKDFPELSEVYAGISINGHGEINPREVETPKGKVKVNYVDRITALPSADVVTQPARGGGFIKFLESVRNANTGEAREIMNEKLRKELKKFAESFKALAESKDEVEAKKVLQMLSESAKNVKAAAKAEDKEDTEEDEDDEGKNGKKKAKAKAEAEDEDDYEEDEDDDELEMTGDDDEYEGDKKEADDEKDDEKEETYERGGKRRMRMSKREAVLRKKLDVSETRRKKAEGALTLESVRKTIEEAGVEGLSEADLARCPTHMRNLFVSMAKSAKEASGYGVHGTTMRGMGVRESKPGAAFMKLLETKGR